MSSWLKWRSDAVSIVLILLLFLSHLPFIAADPDREISSSRGPFTDEGLNTIQVRNFINHGVLDFEECDNLLKTPLLSVVTGAGMALFGTTHLVARLTVLLLLIISLIILSRKQPFSGIMIILVPVAFFKYQAFHFSHFSLAEILSVSFTLMGIFFLFNAYRPFQQEKKQIRLALAAAAMFSLAYYFKIQFIYVILIPPVMAIERWVNSKSLSRKALLTNGTVLTATTIFFLIVYLAAWYLPFKATYDHMMAHQSGGFQLTPETPGHVRFNIEHYFLAPENLLLTLTFLASLLAGALLLFRKTTRNFAFLYKISLLWFILELHKLTMIYLPTRYQVSLFLAMGFLISVVLYELLQVGASNGNRWPQIMKQSVVIAWISLIFVVNLQEYEKTFNRREYGLKQANSYLAEMLGTNDLVIGAWAPSLTWESKNRSFPVWKGFLNDDDPIRKYHPRAIISEPDEQDSEKAYMDQGILLTHAADSIREFRFGPWEVNIYWIRP